MRMADGSVDRLSRGASPGRQRGFTLMELMIVVAIVAILAAVAINAYGFATRKTNRAAAQACLTERAQFMERFYSTNLAYNQTSGGVAVTLPACSTDISSSYDNGPLGTGGGFSVAPTATTFTLELRPKGAQLRDTDCGTSLTIDQTGRKTPATGCW